MCVFASCHASGRIPSVSEAFPLNDMIPPKFVGWLELEISRSEEERREELDTRASLVVWGELGGGNFVYTHRKCLARSAIYEFNLGE